MRRFLTPFSLSVASLLIAASAAVQTARGEFRPPAVPLVTYNPFLSIWSEADHLNDATTKHWTRHDHSLVSLIRIDGKTYRLMGAEPKDAPAFAQKSVEVLPTRSIYEFEDAGVHVTMTFMQPALPDDLDVYSWPLSYITWSVRSTATAAKHKIELYDSTSSQLAVNSHERAVEWSRQTRRRPDAAARRHREPRPSSARAATITASTGATPTPPRRAGFANAAIGADAALEKDFAASGGLPEADDTRMPRSANDAQPVMAFAFDLGSVGRGSRPAAGHRGLRRDLSPSSITARSCSPTGPATA